MQNRPLNEIFRRYLRNECSTAEVSAIIAYFSTDRKSELQLLIRKELEKPDDTLPEEHLRQMSAEVLERIKATIKNGQEGAAETIELSASRRKLQRWRQVAAAACLALLAGTTILFFTQQKNTHPAAAPPPLATHTRDTLPPAADKAVLTLSTGRQINLDQALPGQLATDAHATIRKSASGKVEYAAGREGQPASAPAYNTLATPRGGKYDLTLSDGTRVSLNAASSIRYPSVFPEGSREVAITGEVYFEVAHDAKNPFRVSVAGQLIEDLGTRFNVNAYSNEPFVAATLLEGSIRVTGNGRAALLEPGQQAVIQPGQSPQVKKDVDVEEVTDWHRGLFTFHDADIQTVMRQLSRWYDVDISYEGAIPQRRFSGKIYRNISALKVADILKYKQINFRIEGRKIIVMP